MSKTLNSFNPALLIIDLQQDFLPPTGSLAVPDGRDVIPVINNLIDYQWSTVIATKDWHPKDHCSFASNHPKTDPFTLLTFHNPEDPTKTCRQMVWPVHCLANSFGSEFPPEFSESSSSKIDTLVYKGHLSDREYYSAFEDTWHLDKTPLNSKLQEKSITDVFIVGLALDYCVLNTAVDAAKYGYKTRVIAEATKPVDAGVWDRVQSEFKAQGIELIHLDDPILQQVKN